MPWTRRAFIVGIAGAVSGAGLYFLRRTEVPAVRPLAAGEGPHNVTVVRFGADGEEVGRTTGPRVVRTDADWRKRLDANEYRVMRLAGTEAAYSGSLLHEKRRGVYNCAGCGLTLFNSAAKFDSRTGWPSFWEPAAQENVVEAPDGSMMAVRTAVACRLCDSHMGHVFTDGPKPTGLRYCINSVGLKFEARA